MKTAVVIVAAGSGSRAGIGTPKQYKKLGSKTVLALTIEAFAIIHKIEFIQVVINESYTEKYDEVIRSLQVGSNTEKILTVCFGGPERCLSVKHGLEALERQKTKISHVLIHDAARPLVSSELIASVLDELPNSEAVLPVLPIVDTLWITDKNGLRPGPERDTILRAQTPQGFNFQKILNAHRKNDQTLTDDINLAYKAGLKVSVVHGHEQNFKLTKLSDFTKALRYLD